MRASDYVQSDCRRSIEVYLKLTDPQCQYEDVADQPGRMEKPDHVRYPLLGMGVRVLRPAVRRHTVREHHSRIRPMVSECRCNNVRVYDSVTVAAAARMPARRQCLIHR